jgi:serine protease AprX
MEKNSRSKIGPLRRILCILFFAGAVAAALGAIASSRALSRPNSPEQVAALRKITPWVIEHTADGKQAEFMVILADQANLSGASLLATKAEKGGFVRDALWNKKQATQGPILKWLQEHKLEYRSFYVVNAFWVKGHYEDALALASRSDVARVEGNPQVRGIPDNVKAVPAPSQPSSTDTVEPGISYTHAPGVWAEGFLGQGIVVASADTGFRWTHNAIKPHYRGWNGSVADHNYNWHDSIHNSVGNPCGNDSPQPCDDFFHGSHTLGTAIGDDGGSNQIGMAPQAQCMGCRNMDGGNGTPARYLECMEFFLAPYPIGGDPSQGDPSKAPDVTINSWGCPTSEGCSPNTLQAGVEAQRAAGIMMVVAAGNSGPSCSTVTDPPSLYDASYTVGALNTSTDTIASFSSRGPVTVDGSMRLKPDICAPGTNTRSASNSSDSAYTIASGTSMATPHIAGAVALLWSAHPELKNNPDATELVLNNSAVHILSNTCDGGSPTTPNNTFGNGRVDILAAVNTQAVVSLTSAASRVTQGGAGSFDIDMPLAGGGVEDRSTGGSYTAAFTFDTAVTSGSVSVTSGTATVGAITFSGNEMRAALSGVADIQNVVLHTSNVNGSGGANDVTFGFLIADANGNAVVDRPDKNAVQAGQGPVNASNFRDDLNADGRVNRADGNLVNVNRGHHL